jgi:hypothetical protein
MIVVATLSLICTVWTLFGRSPNQTTEEWISDSAKIILLFAVMIIIGLVLGIHGGDGLIEPSNE